MTEFIDLKWAKIDDEWVIYKDELDEWVETQGIPKCPVCKNTKAGMKNIRTEGNIKRGNCANCGARLAIIKKYSIGSMKKI
jgi:transcription elongation factor Elf1